MKAQTKNQSNRSSRIAGSWQPAPGNRIIAKSKETMAGLSKMRRLTKRIKDLRIGSWNWRSGARKRDRWQKLLKKALVQKRLLPQWWRWSYIRIITYATLDLSNYTGCPRRNVPDFGRVFLTLKCTDITQNTYVQSWTVTEIMAREKCGLLAGQNTVPASWKSYQFPSLSVVSYDGNSAQAKPLNLLQGDM